MKKLCIRVDNKVCLLLHVEEASIADVSNCFAVPVTNRFSSLGVEEVSAGLQDSALEDSDIN